MFIIQETDEIYADICFNQSFLGNSLGHYKHPVCKLEGGTK